MGGLKITQNILDDILNRVDIVEIVSSYIPLKRAGRNFKALCPFHHEKTPSFMVSPQKQIYHCFGCGVGGNVINFLMQYERLSFKEAVEVLAKRLGIELPKEKNEDASLITQIYKTNELACLFYVQKLKENKKLLDYLFNRGLSISTIQEFRIGYAPDGWDNLINYLREKSISLSILDKAGLIVPKEGGGYYDRFRNRITFPIFDIKSRIIGFGARVLPTEESRVAKYINSPETEVYVKGRNLYGLNFTKEYIREKDSVIVVEGYLDFIIPYQEGIKNIVASLGTAFTPEQSRLLKRYTQNIIVVFDGDEAGEIATMRNLDIFIENEMNVRVVGLPKGYDPDTFVRNFGVEKFKSLIDNAQNFFDYKLNVLKNRYNLKEPEEKAKATYEMLFSIQKIKNSILKAEYIKKLAEKMGISEQYIRDEIKKIKEAPTYLDLGPKISSVSSIPAVERLFLKLILEEQKLLEEIKDKINPSDFQDERIAKIMATIIDFIEQGEKLSYHKLMNYLNEDKLTKIICESAFSEFKILPEERQKVFWDCFRRIKERKLKLRRTYLAQQIKFAESIGDRERINQLIKELQVLLKTT